MSVTPDAATAIFAAALQHHRAGRLAEAASFYRRVLATHPTHKGSLFNLAALASQTGQLDQATALYRQVLALAPEDPDTLSNLGNIAAAKNDPAAAEGFYLRALRARPDYAACLANLGSIQIRLNRAEEAIVHLQRALDLEPQLNAARLGLGTAYWNLGRAEEARSCFEHVVTAEPDNIEALGNLANILGALGDHEGALKRLRIALALNPEWSQGHYNLALVLEKIGRRSDAVLHLRRALRLNPDYVEAYRGLANLLNLRGRWRMALALLERARSIDPNDAETEFHLGNIHQSRQEYADAAAHFERAIAINPAVPELFTNLGSVLLALDKPEEAVAALHRALALRPDFTFAWNNLGNALSQLNRPKEAAEAYRTAVKHDPTFAIGFINLGNVLRGLGRFDEGLAALNAGIELSPDTADAHNNVGLVLQAQCRHQEAIAAFQRALAVQAGHPEAMNNLAISYQSTGNFGEAIRLYRDVVAKEPNRSPAYFNLGGALQLIGRYDESVGVFKHALKIRPDYNAVYPYLCHALMQQCSWSNLDAMIAKMLANTEEELLSGAPISVSGFGLMGTSAPMDLRLRVANYMSQTAVRNVVEMRDKLVFKHVPSPDKRIRVGYVSPDYRHHSVATAFRGLLEAHDRRDFAIYGYALSPVGSDDVTEQLRRRFDKFHDVSALSFQDAASQINADGVNILIDLAGHTRFARPEIFALRPAPIRAHYLGYSSTIGGDIMQYLITDHRQIAPGMDRYFSEKLVYLPDTFMATTRADVAAEVPPRSEFGLPETGFVFGNFNAHYKFEPRLFSIWMRLLKRVPGSVLWFIRGTPTSEHNLRREAEARGVDPKRLIFSDKLPHRRHLARQKLVDLALDSLHHGGGVTTTDALWVGVPVVTVAGESPPSRNGATLLTAIGLPELVADSIDAYEALAYGLATEPERLAEVKRRLAANRDVKPLFDTERLTRHLESAYRIMYQRWIDGLEPEAIEVLALPPRTVPIETDAGACAAAD